MANGLFWSVSSLVVFEDQLLASGSFDWDGRMRVSAVARWTGQAWASFGTIRGSIRHLRILDGQLYAVGNLYLSHSYTAPMYWVARWDGKTWVPIENQPDLSIFDLAFYQGEIVAAAGFATEPRGTSAGRLYRLVSGAWQPLSHELRSHLHVLGVYGGSLYCGGPFVLNPDETNRVGIARWDGAPTATAVDPAVAAWAGPGVLEPIPIAPAGQPVHIAFRTEHPGAVQIGVYDVRGRRVRSLAHVNAMPGRHTIEWNRVDDRGAEVVRGIYFVRLESAAGSDVRKVLVGRR
jgi:hypothetical protein